MTIEFIRSCMEQGIVADFRGRADALVEAVTLRELIRESARDGRASDLRIRSTAIRGRLDLRWCGSEALPLPALSLVDCDFQEGSEGDQDAGIQLDEATLIGLELRQSRITHVQAPGIRVLDNVDITDLGPPDLGDEKICWCNFSRCVVQGDFRADGISLHAPSSPGPDGPPYPDMGAWRWALNLYAARIQGFLLIRATSLRSRPEIHGGLLLDDAIIGSSVSLMPLNITCKPNRHAISLSRTSIAGSLAIVGVYGDLELQTRCVGPIWLFYASIEGSVDIQGAELEAPNGIAVYAVGVHVGNRLTVGVPDVANSGTRVTANGRLWFLDNKIDGDFNIAQLWVRSDGMKPLEPWLSHRALQGHSCVLDLSNTSIAGTLSLQDNALCGALGLEGVRCRALRDEPSGYRGAQSILLDDFRYSSIRGREWGQGAAGRIESWLPSGLRSRGQDRPVQAPYVPQPYVQLARTLLTEGEETEARKVLSRKATLDAKQRWGADRWYHPRWVGYACLLFYRLGFNYGLSPLRALATLIFFICLGMLGFAAIDAREAMIVSKMPVATMVSGNNGGSKIARVSAGGSDTGAARPIQERRFAAQSGDSQVGEIDCELVQRDVLDDPAAFLATFGSLLIYAADVFIPLIDLREESRCEIGDFRDVEGSKLRKLELTAYQVSKALYAGLGWIVCTLAALTFSGILRNRLAQE